MIIKLHNRVVWSNTFNLNMKVPSILVICVIIRVVFRHISSPNMKAWSILVIIVNIKLHNLNFMWKRFLIKNQKECLSLIQRGPYTDHTQQKRKLLLAQGETPISPILCGYEYWASFWLFGLWSISHISSVSAVVIPLRGNHFSCHRGRAAPDTLNDPPLGETTLCL